MNIEKNMIVSSIFGLAVGDALGVPVEFVKREKLVNYHTPARGCGFC